MAYFFLGLGIISVIVFCILRKPVVPLSTVIVKGITSIFFIFTALFGFVGNEHCNPLVGALTVAGACFGMLGDIVLDLKYTYPQDSHKFLRCGFISFLIGHLFYCASLIIGYGVGVKNIIFALVGGVFMFLFPLLTEKKLKVKYGEFKALTAIYTGVIGLTVGLGMSYTLAVPNTHSIMFGVAMIFFLISDGLLAGIYFGIDEKDRKNQAAITVNHICYYIAQYLIAASLIFYRG